MTIEAQIRAVLATRTNLQHDQEETGFDMDSISEREGALSRLRRGVDQQALDAWEWDRLEGLLDVDGPSATRFRQRPDFSREETARAYWHSEGWVY